MPTIHSFSFTPATACSLVLTAMAAIYSRRASGVNGNTRLFCTQDGTTTYSDEQRFPDGESSRGLSQQHAFSVVGGLSCTVGLEATSPGVGGYQIKDIHLKAEQIKR